MVMKTMHLFAGVGGGLLADRILGHEPIIAVEWEPYACQVLRERARDGWFPDLQVWEGDVRLFDPSEYAGKVDCIHAGFPCQDISVAGKQAGVSEGTRSGLYREVLRIADTVRPRYLFLENVAAILSNGLGTVLGDLAAMGYDCRWCCLRASDVGAPHHRDRWWLLAYSSDDSSINGEIRADISERHQKSRGANLASSSCRGGKDLADSNGSGQQQSNEALAGRTAEQLDCRGVQPGSDVSDTDDQGSQGWLQDRSADQKGRQEQSVRRTSECGAGWEVGGNNYWASEPLLGRVVDGVPNRINRLKGLGNAQVPLQAAVAWRLLGGE